MIISLKKKYLQLKQLPELIREEEVYNLLTFYASRALELNVIRVVQPSSESYLVAPPATVDYVVPQEIPDKSQWVHDNQVLCGNKMKIFFILLRFFVI